MIKRVFDSVSKLHVPICLFLKVLFLAKHLAARCTSENMTVCCQINKQPLLGWLYFVELKLCPI